MFQLVGMTHFQATFNSKTHRCVVEIRPEGINYTYKLTVDGSSYATFSTQQRILNKSWVFDIRGEHHSVVLGTLLAVDDFIFF